MKYSLAKASYIRNYTSNFCFVNMTKGKEYASRVKIDQFRLRNYIEVSKKVEFFLGRDMRCTFFTVSENNGNGVGEGPGQFKKRC